MDCGSSGFHDGDETSTRTYASVVRGEDSSAPMTNSWWRKLLVENRLRVVSNFGDCDCGAGKIHTRARKSSRRRDAKGAPKI